MRGRFDKIELLLVSLTCQSLAKGCHGVRLGLDRRRKDQNLKYADVTRLSFRLESFATVILWTLGQSRPKSIGLYIVGGYGPSSGHNELCSPRGSGSFCM
ncbi:hypothetical protein BDV25DRAFT_44746 [Aspergillus avenaceus]|uniref:Uncharacterized protein n=1 Tax=Aspergillus avenaceus TaxID=36643 RepID=A0A5N6U383_ASPAV|nr:hypothetical protein BDV25DRAFT_44746 [Aspergillus avenaceus]